MLYFLDIERENAGYNAHIEHRWVRGASPAAVATDYRRAGWEYEDVEDKTDFFAARFFDGPYDCSIIVTTWQRELEARGCRPDSETWLTVWTIAQDLGL